MVISHVTYCSCGKPAIDLLQQQMPHLLIETFHNCGVTSFCDHDVAVTFSDPNAAELHHLPDVCLLVEVEIYFELTSEQAAGVRHWIAQSLERLLQPLYDYGKLNEFFAFRVAVKLLPGNGTLDRKMAPSFAKAH